MDAAARALQSLNPAWVGAKEGYITEFATMYDHVAVITSGNAGIYGYFSPTGGNDIPADLAGLSGITAVPATDWTTGQAIMTLDGELNHFDTAAWAAGAAT